jgi:hypothetical protein
MLQRAGIIAGVVAIGALGTAPVASAKLKTFSGHLVEKTTQTPNDPGCGGFRNDLAGTGTTTLGRTSAKGRACISLSSNGSPHMHDGRVVLTISRGNTVNVSYEAFGPPPDSGGIFHLNGYFLLNGGTGKYKDLYGAGSLTVSAGFVSDTTLDLKGHYLLPPKPAKRSAR